jgi:hypothetical protein
MNLTNLRTKAKNNTLEVEHILQAAKLRLPNLKETLSELSLLNNWSYETYLADGSHVVPFAKWAQVAGEYAEGSFSALAALAKNPGLAPFIIALLEEIHSLESLNALIDFYMAYLKNPTENVAISWHLTLTINMLCSLKDAVPIKVDDASQIREFLSSFYVASTLKDFPLKSVQVKNIQILTIQANVVYALRGVGDESTLDFLAKISDFEYPYQDANKVAILAIKKRLRSALKLK